MTWGHSESFSRAILHIDGDSFFASCEVAKDPKLRGKPVITGKERGIVSACTYEAKARGVKRGMTLSEVRKVCPDAIILPSDYETYSLFSNRMYAIVRRYTPAVEEYSIDECFADITGLRRLHKMPYQQIAKQIKNQLDTELGMTFSIGLSVTKTLAKIGSKWKKPSGFTPISLKDSGSFLRDTPIENIWGIGSNTTAFLNKHGIHTASDFVHKNEEWVRETVAKPYYETWRELKGEVVFELDTEGRETYQSISKTKTFTPPSKDPSFVFSQLSKNIENACIKARRWNLVASNTSFFLKTQDFKYQGVEIKLTHPTNIPQDILRAVSKHFPILYKKNIQYRATGITLSNLQENMHSQLDLFGSVESTGTLQNVYESLDGLSEKFGKHTVFLGSSFKAMTGMAHRNGRGDVAKRATNLFIGENKRKRLAIPTLGEVR